jgi:hypothetical protein
VIGGGAGSEQAGHELLLRLAGRLPDELLWRLRDWQAVDAHSSITATLPRELLRHRVALDDHERALLVASAGAWGASPRLMDAVLPLPAPDDTTSAFRSAPEIDQAALSVLAVVRGHPGCIELRQAWRAGVRREQRVVLVHGGERPWRLTGMLGRILRAHGDRTPCVEVLPSHEAPTAYHHAAIIGSAALWRSPTIGRSPVMGRSPAMGRSAGV